MTALLHKLAVDAFQRASSAGGCLEVSVRYVPFNVQAADKGVKISHEGVVGVLRATGAR